MSNKKTKKGPAKREKKSAKALTKSQSGRGTQAPGSKLIYGSRKG